jgi:pimeloyl-ACP methyl ester carboxylesterase
MKARSIAAAVGLGGLVACAASSNRLLETSSTSRPAMTESTALTSAPSYFTMLDGRRVHYKSLGRRGPTLVFVHGWTCNLEFWSDQAGVFARSARILAVDLPGHGASEPPSSYSMDLFARAVEAAMRNAGVDRAVLVGHSMGALVIRQFSRLFPQKTIALVAVDGSFKPFSGDAAAADKFLGSYRTEAYRDQLSKMADFMFSPATPDDRREQIRRQMLATPQPVIVGAGAAMFDPALNGEDPIPVPVLVVLAPSPMWTADYEAFVRRIAPRLEYRRVEGAGHFLMIDKPYEFNEILGRFLQPLGFRLST